MNNLMIMSTHTGVGKNLIVSGLLRILTRQGISAAPFKGCNIEHYYHSLPNGSKMSFAQAIQCKAAKVDASHQHSPIVALCPDATKDPYALIVEGRLHELEESDINHWEEKVRNYKYIVSSAADSLATEHDILVIEGAGSPVELGLQFIDIPNCYVASHTNADIILTTEMIYGGGYAHLIGTLGLLPDTVRNKVKGFILNKFPISGQKNHAFNGIRQLEEISGIPVVGTIPCMLDTYIPGEAGNANSTNDDLNHLDEQFDSLADEFNEYIDVNRLIEAIN